MHCYALEYLMPQPGMKCLDVGCGSGYLVACMSKMVGREGFVIGIEHIQGLVDLSIRNLERMQPPILKNYKILLADGRYLLIFNYTEKDLLKMANLTEFVTLNF
jgi:protein-L-isoaspartate(D-aspartate) O-methyltransferase